VCCVWLLRIACRTVEEWQGIGEVCVCVCVRERECVCVRERECVCTACRALEEWQGIGEGGVGREVCVCLCERERECVCVCARAQNQHVHSVESALSAM